MTCIEIKKAFEEKFDLVGIIKTKKYIDEAHKMGKKVPFISYPMMVVVGLAYPYRVLKHTTTHLVSSFYTFGKDYHDVLKKRIDEVMRKIPLKYECGVDNHPQDERLAAVLAGIGFFGKNQLIISEKLGSYFFLGMIMIDANFDDEVTLNVSDDCKDCDLCIKACPTKALSEEGYLLDRCISFYNQSKKKLNAYEIEHNHLLFGCDICQIVCPKNINKGIISHPEFDLTGKEMVSIVDLFTQSEKEFRQTYQGMSYLWKGKTILMRNAVMILHKQKNHKYQHLIKAQIEKSKALWFKETAHDILMNMKETDKKVS